MGGHHAFYWSSGCAFSQGGTIVGQAVKAFCPARHRLLTGIRLRHLIFLQTGVRGSCALTPCRLANAIGSPIMHACTGLSPLRLSVSFGTCTPRLSALLALQRAEEPQTPLRLHEVTLADQLAGLTQGAFDGGLALTCAAGAALQACPLWSEDLAIAMPAQSPLRAFEVVPMEEASRYPLIRWHAPACDPVSTLVDALFPPQRVRGAWSQVRSYELMGVLIQAGYGIGIGVQSRIAWLGAPDIVTRPLCGFQGSVTTYLLHSNAGAPAAVDRLARRGRTTGSAMSPGEYRR